MAAKNRPKALGEPSAIHSIDKSDSTVTGSYLHVLLSICSMLAVPEEQIRKCKK